MKKTGLNEYVYDFRVYHYFVAVDILDQVLFPSI